MITQQKSSYRAYSTDYQHKPIIGTLLYLLSAALRTPKYTVKATRVLPTPFSDIFSAHHYELALSAVKQVISYSQRTDSFTNLQHWGLLNFEKYLSAGSLLVFPLSRPVVIRAGNSSEHILASSENFRMMHGSSSIRGSAWSTVCVLSFN